MEFSMKDIYGERYQICRKLRIGAQFTKEIHMIYIFFAGKVRKILRFQADQYRLQNLTELFEFKTQ